MPLRGTYLGQAGAAVGPLITQLDFLGNRQAGVRIAKIITDYQDKYPDRPVYVIGHSGGGGVAVFAAEAMPAGRKIDGLILLSASISSAYDLKKALSHCRNGIVNFYNKGDAGVLGVGTMVIGTVDGTHGPSAGLIGFDAFEKPGYEGLHQVKMVGVSEDSHTTSTQVGFVANFVAPWVLSDNWPAGANDFYVDEIGFAPQPPGRVTAKDATIKIGEAERTLAQIRDSASAHAGPMLSEAEAMLHQARDSLGNKAYEQACAECGPVLKLCKRIVVICRIIDNSTDEDSVDKARQAREAATALLAAKEKWAELQAIRTKRPTAEARLDRAKQLKEQAEKQFDAKEYVQAKILYEDCVRECDVILVELHKETPSTAQQAPPPPPTTGPSVPDPRVPTGTGLRSK